MQSPRLADGYNAADVTPNTMIVLRQPQGANQLISVRHADEAQRGNTLHHQNNFTFNVNRYTICK